MPTLKAQRHRISPNVRPSSLRILIKGLLRSLLIIEFNLASTQALACSDEILDTVGVFARRSFAITNPRISACFGHKKVASNLRSRTATHDGKRPPNVPQRDADQAAHARYAVHAHTFLLGGFVSVENKESCIYLPKLDVAGSIPVARSIFLSDS
jgi:hypothetical protein